MPPSPLSISGMAAWEKRLAERWKEECSMRLDDTDKRILKELKRNGRISHAQLAKRVGIPTQTVGRRVRAMEENRTILGYTVVLPGETGILVVPAAIFIRFDRIRRQAWMIETLTNQEESIEFWAATGEWEAVAVAPHWDAGLLSDFQERLLTHSGVEQFKIAFTMPGKSFDLEGEAARLGCALVPGSRISRNIPRFRPELTAAHSLSFPMDRAVTPACLCRCRAARPVCA